LLTAINMCPRENSVPLYALLGMLEYTLIQLRKDIAEAGE